MPKLNVSVIYSYLFETMICFYFNFLLDIRCPALPKPTNGRKSENRYWPGTLVRFSCNDGYRLTGYETRRCREDGLWSWGVEAECISTIAFFPLRFVSMNINLQFFSYSIRWYQILWFRCWYWFRHPDSNYCSIVIDFTYAVYEPRSTTSRLYYIRNGRVSL